MLCAPVQISAGRVEQALRVASQNKRLRKARATAEKAAAQRATEKAAARQGSLQAGRQAGKLVSKPVKKHCVSQRLSASL